jgi:hypothetical protein
MARHIFRIGIKDTRLQVIAGQYFVLAPGTQGAGTGKQHQKIYTKAGHRWYCVFTH